MRVNLKKEPIEVQAAFKYLSEKPYSLWGDWMISDPKRRLEAARWLAKQYEGVDKILRSNDFRPE